MAEKPKGATVVKDTPVNEAGAMMRKAKRQAGFDKFIDEKRKAELESINPKSGDYEVMKNVDAETLKQLQKDKRLVGWSNKTRTALVLKVDFAKKKEEIKKRAAEERRAARADKS